MNDSERLKHTIRTSPKPRIWKWRPGNLARHRVGWAVAFPTTPDRWMPAESWQDALEAVARWYAEWIP